VIKLAVVRSHECREGNTFEDNACAHPAPCVTVFCAAYAPSELTMAAAGRTTAAPKAAAMAQWARKSYIV
jgi:hypothetical protein